MKGRMRHLFWGMVGWILTSSFTLLTFHYMTFAHPRQEAELLAFVEKNLASTKFNK